jgi:glutathione S-transferase
VTVALDTPTALQDKLRHSPSGRVPVLHDGDTVVWDSLAICEYAAERHPERRMWPHSSTARARARSICAEMHSGFTHLRTELPMNCRARKVRRERSTGVLRDVERIVTCWRDTRAEFGSDGPFLFGAFSIADAFFAPVASRFFTYDVAIDEEARAYQEALFALPAVQLWMAAAEDEPIELPHVDEFE